MSSDESTASVSISPELAEVLDSILRDLGQVVQYDRVHILLLSSALQPIVAPNPIGVHDADLLITVRDRGTVSPDLAERDNIPLDLYPLNRLLLDKYQPIVISDTEHDVRWVKEGASSGIRAWIGAPLVVKDKAIGVLTLHSRTPGAYTDRDGSMVFAFANQAAEAIDKVQLLEQAQSRLRAMQALRNISLRMISSLNIDQVLNTICDNVLQLIDAEDAHIFWFDEKLGEYTQSVALWRSGERRPAVSKPRKSGLTERVRLAAEPIVIDDAPSHELYSSPEALKWGIQSIAGFPLKAGQRVLGVFTVAYLVPHHFGEDELRVLNLLADQAAIALENARLYQAMQHQLEIQSRLYQVNSLLRSTLDVNEVLNAVASTVFDLFQPAACTMSLIDLARGVITYPVVRGGRRVPPDVPLSQLPADLVERGMAGKVTILDSLEHYPEMQQLYDLPPHVGMLVVPIVGQQRTQGVISIITRGQPRFDADQMELITTLANQSAVAIENALAYHALQTALAEQARTQQALIRSESLAAVGQLVAGVAHELNNPLASVTSLVQSSLETLGIPYKSTGESSGRLPVIRPDQIAQLPMQDLVAIGEDLAFSLKELRRAKGIVAALLDLSRQSTEYADEVSLTNVCQDALRVLFNKLRLQSLEIVEQYADDLPTLRGNFATLGQVALNIIQNAAESFDKKPGRIELGTYYDAARDIVGFYVTDNGPGIAPEVMPNIFHPFFTTKKAGVGTGLGLYISYEIINRHGGSILVDSEEGHGATFKVELPRVRVSDQ
jgi:two-component system NtrC family sensor kinase